MLLQFCWWWLELVENGSEGKTSAVKVIRCTTKRWDQVKIKLTKCERRVWFRVTSLLYFCVIMRCLLSVLICSSASVTHYPKTSVINTEWAHICKQEPKKQDVVSPHHTLTITSSALLKFDFAGVPVSEKESEKVFCSQRGKI